VTRRSRSSAIGARVLPGLPSAHRGARLERPGHEAGPRHHRQMPTRPFGTDAATVPLPASPRDRGLVLILAQDVVLVRAQGRRQAAVLHPPLALHAAAAGKLGLLLEGCPGVRAGRRALHVAAGSRSALPQRIPVLEGGVRVEGAGHPLGIDHARDGGLATTETGLLGPSQVSLSRRALPIGGEAVGVHQGVSRSTWSGLTTTRNPMYSEEASGS
jgi:hypothetical protein